MAQSLQIPVEINLKTKKEDFDKLTSKLENKGIAVKLTVTNEELKNFREIIQKKFSNKNNRVSIGLTVNTTTVKELRREIQKKLTKPINIPLSVTEGQVNKIRNQIQRASREPVTVSVQASTESLRRVREQISGLGSQQQSSGSSSNVNAFSQLLSRFTNLGGTGALSGVTSSIGKIAVPLGFITSGFSLVTKKGENFFKTTAKVAQATVNVITKIANNIKKVVSVVGGAVNNIKSKFNILNSTLARGLSLTALVAVGKKGLELSSDLAEVQNVVETTFGKSSNIINEFAESALKNFGLTELQAKKYVSTLGAIAKASGESDEATLQMSTNLTKLTADVASFFNYDYDTAFNKIRSGLTGETEPLKDLGVVMTVANLEQYRLAQGIQTSYSAMSSAEQMALRYNYIMQALTDTQGDFNKTQASWANQLRILQGQAQQLGAILGNLLQKVLYPVLSVVNAILGKAVAMGNVLAKAFGFDTKTITESQSGTNEKSLPNVATATDSPNVATATDKEAKSQDNLAKSTKKATAEKKKQNKEREKELASVHKLNILNKKQAEITKAGTGTKANKNSTPKSGINTKGGLGFDLLNYADTTNKGVKDKDKETAFENFIKRMKKLAKEGQYEGIGASLADEVNGLVSKMHFKEVEGKFIKFSNKIGRIINGFVRNLNTAQIGRKLGDLINLIVHTVNTFYDTVDFSAIGSKLAEGLNSAFETIDWEALGQFLLNKFNSIFRFLAGFAETFDWLSFGVHLSELINSAFDSIDFEAIESFVVNGVNGITNAMWDVLFGTDWGAKGVELGQSVSIMIQGIKWDKLAINLAHGLASLIDFGINFAEQVLSDDNLSKITNAITTFFSNFFEEVKEKKLGKRLAEVINKGVKILNDLINEIPWEDIYNTIDDFITNLDWVGILRNIANLWSAKKSILINAGMSIMRGVFKSIMDSIGEEIDKLTNKIYNGVIDGLNSLPFINIKTHSGGGTSIDDKTYTSYRKSAPMSIPHLAKGAVIPPNNKFLAMLGDQTSGTNIETPLSTMIQAFKSALGDSNYNGMGDIYIPIYVNNELTSEELIRKQEIERYRSNGKH